MNEVSLAPSRLPIQSAIAKEYDLTPAIWRVLVEQTFPNARTVEAVLMALAYCRERKLDILKRPVHIVPMWSAAKKQMVETVWPGIAEIRTTATRTGQYAGIDAVEFGTMIEETFTGTTGGREAEKITKTVRYPEWASVIVYRMIGNQRCPFHTKVYWEESYATVGKSGVPNEMWAKRPRGQLDKCVEAAALRKAFPEELGAVYAAEEMEGRTIDHDEIVEPDRPKPPKPPVKSLSQPIQPPKGLGAEPPVSSVQRMPPTPPKPPVKAPKAAEANARYEPQTTGNTAPEQPGGAEIDALAKEVSELASIYDPETGEIGDVEPTPTELLASLSEMLETAKDETEVEEIWDGHDVEARLEGVENGDKFLTLAFGLKQKNLTRVGG